ncbi:MAG: efflux RND transporter periplasmic adaptor subunit [Chromatiales bacterium]|jgi:HlyD family secretion protein
MKQGMTKIFSSLLSLAVIAGGAWYWLQQPEEAAVPQFSTDRIQREDINAVVSATGTLNPINTVQVGSQVSGTIQHLYADFNDRVTQGQVIAQIDPAIFKAKRAEALATLQSAEAERDKAWVSVLDTKREYERQADLQKKKLVAESVVDTARFAYQSAQVEHKVKAASVAQAQAALDREQVNLDYTTIYAPIDGVVISRDVDVGQTVAASLQAPTLFSIAEDLTRMQVEADVDEAFIGEVKPGQPVSFTVFAYPNRSFEGEVAQVRLQPTIEAGVVKYNCIIHVDNSDLALKPGMTATVGIEVSSRQQVLTAPNAALRFVPELPQEKLQQVRKGLKTGEAILWQVQDNNELTPLTVSTGIIGEKNTEISGAGLSEGMGIAVPLKRGDAKRKRRFGLSLF